MLSNFLESGQVLILALIARPTAMSVLKVPLGPQWLMDFVTVGSGGGALTPAVND